MSRITLVLSLLITIFSGIAPSALAAETGNGTVRGQVVNGTADGSNVAGQEIILKTYLNENEISAATTRTDAEGNFSFDGVTTQPDYEYQVTLFFQSAEYDSERTTFGTDEDTKTITLHVFDATTSDEAVRTVTAHTIIYPGQDSLEVKEYFLFVNDSDRTYTGPAMKPEETGVLKFSLPPGATALQHSSGLTEQDILGTDDGFADTLALLPGMREVAFTYRLPFPSGEYLFAIRVNYPLDNYDLLVQGTEVTASSGQLIQGEPLTITGNQFQHFSGGDFLPQDKIEVRLSSPAAGGGTTLPWLAAVLLVMVFAVSLGYLWMKKRTPPVPVAAGTARSRETLLQEIARLDDAFQSGTILENEYRRQRAEKKQQLVEMMTGAEKKG